MPLLTEPLSSVWAVNFQLLFKLTTFLLSNGIGNKAGELEIAHTLSRKHVSLLQLSGTHDNQITSPSVELAEDKKAGSRKIRNMKSVWA